MAKPIVAIVGRPNVGKSTFFNRMIGETVAIVQDEPGTTRDRIYGETEWSGRTFTLVDTGGVEVSPGTDPNAGPVAALTAEDSQMLLDEITRHTREQAAVAIEEADLILFMVDAKSGLTATDQELAEIMRRSNKPLILVANKADSEERRQNAVEFYQLGLGDPVAISTHHGINTGDLLDMILAQLPASEEQEEEDNRVKIAIVGRPNVGKSRLLNAILGQERVIVSDVPGTTRDAIDTVLEWNDEQVVIIDTAGIRRRGRIERGVEHYSVIRTVRAINRADVVLLVIDAHEGLTAQDAHIAGYVLEANKSIVLVINKWDMVEKDDETMREYTAQIQEELQFLSYAPMIFISAKYGQRVTKVLPIAMHVAQERRKRVPTALLNKLLKDAVSEHQPPSKPGKWVKFYYATQADINPPTFVFFVNEAEAVHFSYKRYLENRLRQVFGYEGTPLKMEFRTRHEEK